MARTKTYKIAEFLPMGLKRKMATQKYIESKAHYDEGIRLCKTGRCPLGWLFADPPTGKLRRDRRLPGSYTIARRIRKMFPSLVKGIDDPDTLGALADYAEEFTDDWDEGLIKNLAVALGVKK